MWRTSVPWSSRHGKEAAVTVKPIPDEYHSVQPYLLVEGARGLMEFIKSTFETGDAMTMSQPDGKIGHAEIRIGDSVVADSSTAEGVSGPMPATVVVYVEDADKIYQRAIEAGAISLREPEDQFYGDRSAGVRDPFGNHWWIHTHIEDVPPEEMAKRMKERQASAP
jgi:PhnB protein